MAAYEKMRWEVMRMIGGVRGTVSANTIRHALEKASKELKGLGEYTVDAVNKAAEAVRREITSTAETLGRVAPFTFYSRLSRWASPRREGPG